MFGKFGINKNNVPSDEDIKKTAMFVIIKKKNKSVPSDKEIKEAMQKNQGNVSKIEIDGSSKKVYFSGIVNHTNFVNKLAEIAKGKSTDWDFVWGDTELSNEVQDGAENMSDIPVIKYEAVTELPEIEPTISLFKTGVLARRALELGLLDLNAPNYDQKPWGLLYKAIVDSLGVDPENFQLIYPFTSWDWPTENVGFINSPQYDFCSSVPQWSAVGVYTSSGDRFNQAYQEFLNVIVADTSDPVLRRRIEEAKNVLTKAANDYDTALNQAKSFYLDSVKDNNPTFTAWLGTIDGKAWQTRITSADTKMQQEQKNLDALVAQANTPGLKNAQTQFNNEQFYSKLTERGLSSFPKVPNWSISENSQPWVDRVKAGEGPAGGTISFSNQEQSYDYSKTWAGGSLSIQKFFWEVQVAGKWQRIQQFESDQSLSVSVEFEAVDQIIIQPSDWYNGTFVRSKANGPFTRGYSAYGGDGTQAVFGKKGFIGLLKTGMYVCYKPTFTIMTSQSTFDSFKQAFEVATALRIGPFSFSADGGSKTANWKASKEGHSFTGQSTSEMPLIFGVTISQLPSQSPDMVSDVAKQELVVICE